MAGIEALVSAYGEDSDSEENDSPKEEITEDHTVHLNPGSSIHTMKSKFQLNVAPAVVNKNDVGATRKIDGTTKELTFNPKYEELFAPEVGPSNPNKTRQQLAAKNMLTGYVEHAHVSDFTFENQRKTFTSFGYAVDPSADGNIASGTSIIGDTEKSKELKGATVFESTKTRPGDKRKREGPGDPGDIEGYKGPWAPFVDESKSSKPSEEESSKLEEYELTKQKKTKKEESKSVEEKSTLHVKDAVDYQGRSYLHIPKDLDIRLDTTDPPERCYLPKRHIHTWTGHTKGVSAIRFFPLSGHLLLSCSMDCKVKLWEVYNQRRCLRTFLGHSKAVRDISFNNSGDQFLSAAYDRYVKRFVSTSDDKSLRVWEWDIPVDFKYIAEPSMHSMPAVSMHPNEKWMACQSMDNQILILGVQNRFRINRKKVFKGHMVAGYACQPNFSPDGAYLISGDADGKLNIWDWKSTKLYCKFKAHDAVCIGCAWHPHETSKVVTCGWDGLIKYWD
ncbi:Pre-mRNA-processing factor 17 [Exaiptasia diaphana]|nr:Pre-mRNA-processing factor 17 [Exaiptasia diaphana]